MPILIDLTQESDQSIIKHYPETAGAQLAFKYMMTRDFTPYRERVLEALKSAPLPIRHITLQYIIYRANVERDLLLEAVHVYLPNDEETVMEMYQQNRQHYISQGISLTIHRTFKNYHIGNP